MAATLILAPQTELHKQLSAAAREHRCVFLAGLSGVGKSLLLQQLSVIAQAAGREVHLLQWDVARRAFETPAILARFPERDGVTHPGIRQAVGLWARKAVNTWDQDHPAASHLLIGELPLIGNRLIELAQSRDDAAEPLLAGRVTLFLVPVPSVEVRSVIEGAREREMARPGHERERANAQLQLVRAHWREIAQVAAALGIAGTDPEDGYRPEIYFAVYDFLLRHRHSRRLGVDTVLPVRGSAHDLEGVRSELVASPQEAARIIGPLAAEPDEALERAVQDWFRV